jgi:hypothetical protein
MARSCGLESYDSGQGPMAGSCEHDNRPVKAGNFLTSRVILASQEGPYSIHG